MKIDDYDEVGDKVLFVRLPHETWAALRIECFEMGLTVRAVVTQMVERWISQRRASVPQYLRRERDEDGST